MDSILMSTTEVRQVNVMFPKKNDLIKNFRFPFKCLTFDKDSVIGLKPQPYYHKNHRQIYLKMCLKGMTRGKTNFGI